AGRPKVDPFERSQAQDRTRDFGDKLLCPLPQPDGALRRAALQAGRSPEVHNPRRPTQRGTERTILRPAKRLLWQRIANGLCVATSVRSRARLRTTASVQSSRSKD